MSIAEINKKQHLKKIKMYKVVNDLQSSSRSHCRVGKITSKKTGIGDSRIIQIDIKTTAFKRSNDTFIGKIRNL